MSAANDWENTHMQPVNHIFKDKAIFLLLFLFINFYQHYYNYFLNNAISVLSYQPLP